VTRYDITCNHCKFNKNYDDENVAYRWAGFHEGENIGHVVEVDEQ